MLTDTVFQTWSVPGQHCKLKTKQQENSIWTFPQRRRWVWTGQVLLRRLDLNKFFIRRQKKGLVMIYPNSSVSHAYTHPILNKNNNLTIQDKYVTGKRVLKQSLVFLQTKIEHQQ